MAVGWLRKEFNLKPILPIDTQPSFLIDITSTLYVPPPQSSTDPIRVNPPQEQEPYLLRASSFRETTLGRLIVATSAA